MKNLPKKLAGAAVLSVAVVAGFTRAQAQETTASGTTPSADSIVALAADSKLLPQVAPAQVPARGVTAWWVYPGGLAVPTPMLPLDSSAPIYSINSQEQEYLVDLTAGAVSVTPYQLKQQAQAANPYATAVTAQVQGLIDLITMVQTPTSTTKATTMTLSAKPMGGPLDPSQGGFPYLTIAPSGTNQFLITVINNTNPSIYELWWTPALADPNYPWQQLVIGASGQTNFTVNNLYQNGFFRAVWDTNGVPTSGLIITIDSPLNGTVFN